MMKIPLVCETADCANQWKVVQVISQIAPEHLDLFYENYDGSDGDNYCPLCAVLAITYDALPENETVRVGACVRDDPSERESGLAVWLG